MKRPFVGFGVAALLACSAGSGAPAESITTRDSAGIEILEHPAGLEALLPKWTVDSVPLVDIGAREEPGHDLHRVGGAAELGDGRIVVINRGSSELRLFDSTGRFLGSVGRAGQGPGEFSDFIGTIQVLAGDSLVAFDTRLQRASVFTPEGQFVRTIPAVWRRERGRAAAFWLMENGRLLAEERTVPDMRETSGPVRREPFALIFVDPGGEGRIDTVAVVPGYETYPALGKEGPYQFPTLSSLGFGRHTVFGSDGRRIFVGTNQAEGIRMYDSSGRLLRLIRSATPPEPVTEADRERDLREMLARFDQQTSASRGIVEQWKEAARERRYAATFPLYERLMVGDQGTVWLERVGRYEDEGRRLVVHDSAGRAIATVSGPERMRPYVVGPTGSSGCGGTRTTCSMCESTR